MKFLQIMVIILFILVAGVYGVFFFYNRANTDLTVPVILLPEGVLEVSVRAVDSDLLSGVAAYDRKDGDLSAQVLVEKISNFIERGVANITYAVIDSDNHVVRASRRIRYVDYESPRFTFSRAMRFPLGSTFNVMSYLGANDLIDGSITHKIRLTSSDIMVGIAGVYEVRAQVTNSKGEVSYISFNVTLYESTRNAPEILLKSYLIYLKTGNVFDAPSYVNKVMRGREELKGLAVTVDSDVDTSFPGIYQADYYVTDENGAQAVTSLVVIVEEQGT